MTEQKERTALDYKERLLTLSDISDRDLGEMHCMPPGAPLEDSELYFDLEHPERNPVDGAHGLTVPHGTCYIPRSSVRDAIWLKLFEGHIGPGLPD